MKIRDKSSRKIGMRVCFPQGLPGRSEFVYNRVRINHAKGVFVTRSPQWAVAVSAFAVASQVLAA